ncbi:unnamed protein product, partial [Polarella glacialis]
AWSWEPQFGSRLLGPALESSGPMTLESAKVAGEADPDCVGFSYGMAQSDEDEDGRYYVTLHGAPPSPASKGNRGSAEDEELVASVPEAYCTSYLKVASDAAHDVRALL